MSLKRTCLSGMGPFLFLVGSLLLQPGGIVFSRQVIAQGARIPKVYIIAIQGDFSQGRALAFLDPRDLRVGRGDPVTWINESEVEVMMRFGRGTQCREVTVKSLEWRLEPDKCYETKDSLKPQGSTSIRFREVGLYTYEIEFVGKERKVQGIIRVQSEDR